MDKLKLGILASTKGTDMQAIIDAMEAGELPEAEISAVISNRQDAIALERARKHDLDAVWIDPKDYTGRESFDRQVAKVLDEYEVELVLMIGYMRIVTPWFVKRYEGRMLNVHPSLLPAFGGGMDTDVHQVVLDSGVKVTGCTIHFVTEEVDSGPIVYQQAIEIAEDETVESLKQKVQEAEQEGFLQVVRWFAQGRVKLEGHKVRIG